MSKAVQYKLVNTEEDGTNITVIVRGKGVFPAHSSHPNYDKIVQAAIAEDESVVDLFDVAKTVGAYFEPLSERVSVAFGQIYFDGEVINNALTQQVVRFLDEGVDDWQPLVSFFENVQMNPNEHSREQLYGWLNDRDFTITPDGLIVGYKGVESDGNGGYQSISTGTAIVDGEVFNGKIPNYVGATVEMPRNHVHHDPDESCSTGLHVATYEYAESWASGAMLEVHVNPRDVVSVPNEGQLPKMRVCRYYVADIIDAPHTVPVLYWESDEALDDTEYCEYCDSDVADCGCEDGAFEENDEHYDDWTAGFEAVVYAPVQEPASRAEATYVKVGDVFEDRDSRRSGRTFTVEAVEDDYAYGMSESDKGSRVRKVRLDRLTSRKYKRVN